MYLKKWEKEKTLKDNDLESLVSANFGHRRSTNAHKHTLGACCCKLARCAVRCSGSLVAINLQSD